MGYPMTWPRLVGRSHLQGDYDATPLGLIKGDMRRLEQDSRDEHYGRHIAEAAGVEPEVARRVLDVFFNDVPHPGRWPVDYVPREPASQDREEPA